MPQVLHAVALVASLLGLLLWTRRRTTLDPATVPVVVLSGAGLVVFLGGLLDRLEPAVWMVVGLGLLALVHELVRHLGASWRTAVHPVTLALAALVAGLVAYLHGLEFAHYDNFSHWALVVRLMLEQNAFPTPAQPIIEFTTYPLGSASVAYAATRVLGGQEWQSMLGQATLLVAALMTVAAFARRHRWLGLLPVPVLYLAVVSTTNQATTLLVDGLVAALGAAAVLLAVRHRRRMRVALVPLAVVLALLGVVKASGLFFVVAVQLLAVVLTVAHAPRPRRRPHLPLLWRMLVMLGLPWLVYGAWTRHVAVTFPDGADAPHSLDASRLEEVGAEKTPAVREQITHLVLDAMRADTALKVALGAGLVVLLLLWRRRLVGGRGALAALLAVALGTAAYLAGVLATYLLSMKTSEALHLAGFRRYTGTGTLVLLTLAVAGLLALVDGMRHVLLRLLGTVAALGVLAVFVGPLGQPLTLPRQNLVSALRDNADRAVEGAQVPAQGEVCIVLDERDASYRRFLLRYLLMTPDVSERLITPETSKNLLTTCRHVVLLKENARAAEMLAELGSPLPHPPPVMVTR
ncbi:hypothetical protein KMZ32_14875 [Phycicoccus sp. MAQZ13P-2]|uniref:hypothetical protein n=1 Tax=Phycicoccus mangrovi TaxID=2840470 RepID=UPI001BFFDBAB|nr:hypothetical protein [Phycicoccus mangrovi]MBT9255644.1 hypothetical protein [Phycicoccus mangrovi]MBT9275358.1 hypothetical protein [Phycicoccus mangrovi]